MPSASTMGKPIIAAGIMPSTELLPPISLEMKCVTGRPVYAWIALNAAYDWKSRIFSTLTVGAPMPPTHTTLASSRSSSGSWTVTGP